MQELEQQDYFERRAEEERTAAANAADERAAQSHRDLAQHYQEKAQADAKTDQEPTDLVSATFPPEGFKIIP